jgi:hypothetical protein
VSESIGEYMSGQQAANSSADDQTMFIHGEPL